MSSVTAGMPTEPSYLSIGEVLTRLRETFPDVTISKIRFLESEGLVEPERSRAGYRQFSVADVERLQFVLECQRDRYLPLRVIREHLAAVDRGEDPAVPADAMSAPETSAPETSASETSARDVSAPDVSAPDAPEGRRRPEPSASADPPAPGLAAGPPNGEVPPPLSGAGRPSAPRSRQSDPAMHGNDLSEVRLNRRELAAAAGLRPEQLTELERYGLVATRSGGSHYDGDALVVARTVAAMGRYGLEPRHLRAFKTAADREVGLIEQVISPYSRARGGDARRHAATVARELAGLSLRLHTALVRAGLSGDLLR